ncbi:MAG: hypothetical protein ABW178_05610 [Pseudoxanthomonas sp.]
MTRALASRGELKAIEQIAKASDEHAGLGGTCTLRRIGTDAARDARRLTLMYFSPERDPLVLSHALAAAGQR